MRGASLVAALAIAGGAVVWAAARQTVWDGVYTEDQARRGAALYMAHCADCHGESLGGVESAPALTGVAFNSTWEGVPLADLFERMRTSMPPGKPGAVPRQGYADVLAFMLQRSGMPSGGVALGTTKAGLDRIRFVSNRP
jgi:S-disulfanyl-L-cysteine oxidoreductase SoxD